jgi:SAM-dependent methyltransferase
MNISQADRMKIDAAIRGKYSRVAAGSPGQFFKYPTGRAGLEVLNYPSEILRSLPESAIDSFCGVGNPFSLGVINEGEHILDIGCGGGVDVLIAAIMTGPEGKVTGIDISPEMLDTARENSRKAGFENISFEESSAEDLPFPDRSFDVVLSSGAFNLIPDKTKALQEVFRVLKPQGRFMMADQVLTGSLPQSTEARIANWAG